MNTEAVPMKIYKRIKKNTLPYSSFTYFCIRSRRIVEPNLWKSRKFFSMQGYSIHCYLVHFTLLKNNYFDVGTKYSPNNETLFHYCKIEHKFIKGRYDALHSRTFCIRSRWIVGPNLWKLESSSRSSDIPIVILYISRC